MRALPFKGSFFLIFPPIELLNIKFVALIGVNKNLLKDEKGCDCNFDLTLQKKLQKYEALKVGHTASDIQLDALTKLSDSGRHSWFLEPVGVRYAKKRR